MKRWVVSLAIVAITGVLVGSGFLSGQQAQTPNTNPKGSVPFKPKWPRTYLAKGAKVVVYQPQLKS
jgi:hypothetical protein